MIQVEGKSVQELEELNARRLVGVNDIPEYWHWHNMKTRCYNSNRPDYRHYGGRGIKVCEEWRNNFWAFFHHVGRRLGPGYSINRINNDGNYEPGNVNWATPKEQANNQRQPWRKLTDEDVAHIRAMRGVASQIHLAIDYGVSNRTISDVQRYRRYANGKQIEPPPKLSQARPGSASSFATINEDDALYIKMLLAEGQLTNWEIAEEVGTSEQIVRRIKRGEHWTHVHLPDNWRELLAEKDKNILKPTIPVGFVRRF
jgi:hypothetical protein